MTSEKQIEANRINALNSTGPQTTEGKARSCRNAFKHGLSSKHFVIDGEDYLYIDQTLDDLIEHYQPQSQDEYLLLECIVHGMINRQRGEHIMQQYYFVAERGGPLRYLDYIPGIQRYIRDSDRTVEKAYEIFFRIRAEQHKENKPVTIIRPKNGFVFATRIFKERKITSRPIHPSKRKTSADRRLRIPQKRLNPQTSLATRHPRLQIIWSEHDPPNFCCHARRRLSCLCRQNHKGQSRCSGLHSPQHP